MSYSIAIDGGQPDARYCFSHGTRLRYTYGKCMCVMLLPRGGRCPEAGCARTLHTW